MSGAAIAFAVNCQRYGIGSAQCTESALRSWSAYTQRRSPTNWDIYYAPLMAELDPKPAPASIAPAEPGERYIQEGYAQALLAAVMPGSVRVGSRTRPLRL